jgi:hypothetical protein
MRDLWGQGTFEAILSEQAKKTPIPTTWVFKYKTDKHGFLTKFKARLCVRGDLQPLDDKETYAATLAGRSFRVLMAIAAKFQLEARQLDAVNAFTNSLLDEEVYIRCPDGFKRHGWSLRLRKALYGLRRSPLLWQRDLLQTFQQLGLQQCAEDPCICNNSWLTVFFFVDDIVLLYRMKDQLAAETLINRLKQRYQMQDLGDLSWFLGIRILRDKLAKKLWLCQDSYIEKTAARFKVKLADDFKGNPLPANNLQKNPYQARQDQVILFQQKVGSINYIAVISRPDIAKAAARLAEHLLNPTEDHHRIADRVISYLYATRYLAIQFSGQSPKPTIIQIAIPTAGSAAGPAAAPGPADQTDQDLEFLVASDAAFADDPKTRKSSQGMIMTLFGGPISWKAGKQDTVTTSSTEAELLAFTHTAKEALATQRLFQQLDLQLDQQLVIQCDNQQTIRLITLQMPRIRTALRHVDIHSCWARQSYLNGLFQVTYTKTAEMLADGLTKPLPGQKFELFVRQLGLIDIRSLIEAQIETDDEG